MVMECPRSCQMMVMVVVLGFLLLFFCHSFLMLAVSGCQPFFLLHCGGGFVERGYWNIDTGLFTHPERATWMVNLLLGRGDWKPPTAFVSIPHVGTGPMADLAPRIGLLFVTMVIGFCVCVFCFPGTGPRMKILMVLFGGGRVSRSQCVCGCIWLS